MKSSAIVMVLAGVAMSQPHLAHKHRHQYKRAIEWHTEVIYETQTVDVFTTIWINEGESETPTPIAVLPTPSSIEQVPTSAISPVVVTPTATYTPTTASVELPTIIEEIPSTTSLFSSTPAVVDVPETSSNPVYVAPVPTTLTVSTTSSAAAIIPSVVSNIGSSGSLSDINSIVTSKLTSGSQCVGSQCSGDLTFYQAGLGACGYDTDGTTVYGIALPWEFMGPLSNSNPYCNMTLSITYGDKTIPATVIDKCMGCSATAIDLTYAAFDALGIDEALGRVKGSWKFTGPPTAQEISAADL